MKKNSDIQDDFKKHVSQGLFNMGAPIKKRKNKKHTVDLEIFKFGEYIEWQCTCGELMHKSEKKCRKAPAALAGVQKDE